MKRLVLTVACLFLVAGLRPAAMGAYLDAQRYEGLLVLPSAPAAQWMSLGHTNAFADLLWLRGLVYAGDELHHRGNAEFVYDLANLVVDLDPDFRRAYLWAGVAGLYRAQGVGVDDMMPAVELLRTAARRFPDDGEVAWELGATLRYEIAPLVRDPALRRTLEQEASEHLAVAARLGAGPPWLALTSTQELTRLGELERARAHLRALIPVVGDDDLRAELLAQLEGLDGAADAEALRATLDAERDAARRSFPWVPAELVLLLGPRVVPP